MDVYQLILSVCQGCNLLIAPVALLDCEGWLPDTHGSVIISIRGPHYHSHSASKVELYVGRRTGGGAFSMDHTHFTRLGYVSLSENEQTGFRVSGNGCESNSYVETSYHSFFVCLFVCLFMKMCHESNYM